MKNIQWREWSDEAFREAEESRKPVLLSLSAVWCHWCHVMDDSTYSVPAVYEMINANFIPVRVDSDRNPDINTRYNMGGWPSTVFLTYGRDILTGATYLPPQQMLPMLQRVSEVYSADFDDVIARARENTESVAMQYAQGSPSAAVEAIVSNVIDTARSSFDAQYGGFGTGQKFPHAGALRLLLYAWEHARDSGDLTKVTHTLDHMVASPLFDKVEGGMFRYATQRDWTEPHYEKMLEDNARIVSVLLDAHRVTGQDTYLSTARSLLGYVETVLTDAQSGLSRGSQDADEHYYSLDSAGRSAMQAPRVDSAAYVDSNCLLARAYIKLYGVVGDRAALDRGLQIVSTLNGLPRGEDGTPAHYVEDGQPRRFGNLADLAELLMANVACAEASGDSGYVRVAEELAAAAHESFAEHGAWSDVSAHAAQQRGVRRFTAPVPENAVLAMALTKLADLIDNAGYRQTAVDALTTLAGHYAGYGLMAAGYAMAVSMAGSQPLVATVTRRGGDQSDRLVAAAVGICGENCTVRVVDAESQDEPAAAMVCLGEACRARVTDAAEVGSEIGAAMVAAGYGAL